MSNFLAVATVTASLRRIIQSAVGIDVPGATVTNVRPDGGAGTPSVGVNIFMYQVTPNAAWRNADLPSRASDGSLITRPQAAIDLYFLMSFYGNDTTLEPQRLLGSVVRTLHSNPVLGRQTITDTIADPTFSYLVTSNLAQSVELVKFTPTALNLEELSKLWSVFFQTAYRLSVAYHATVVLIESDAPTVTPLPVKTRSLVVLPFQDPTIEKIYAQAGEGLPIVSTSTLVIDGSDLISGQQSALNVILLRGVEVTPQTATNTRMVIPLAGVASLRAGVQPVQVVQKLRMGQLILHHRAVESAVSSVIVHPTISSVAAQNVTGSGSNPRAADIQLTIGPTVGKEQRVVLMLNESSGSDRKAYSFEVPSRVADGTSLTVYITGVKASTYLVRVHVDGADSALTVDGSGNYNGPTVTIP